MSEFDYEPNIPELDAQGRQHGHARSRQESNPVQSPGPTSGSGPGTTGQPTLEEASTASHLARGSALTNTPPPGSARGRWMVLALGSVLLVTLLIVAGIVLVTRPASTVDQVLILTVPSGAEVTLDTLKLGHSPVKLEGIRMGPHRLVITRDGFQAVSQELPIVASQTFEFKLKPEPPRGAEGRSKDEQRKEYQAGAEAAFARGDYAVPYQGRSALYFADMVLSLDENNQFGLDMRERVRKMLIQQAQGVVARGDLGQAEELMNALNEYFPRDEAAHAAATRLEAQLASHRGDIRDLVRKAEDALKAGKLTQPDHESAYFYSRQALAIDRGNTRARAVRNQVHDHLVSDIDQAILRNDFSSAMSQLEAACGWFPEDKQLRNRLNDLQNQQLAKVVPVNDPTARRNQGLTHYRMDEFAEAEPDLEFAVENGRGTPDVLFALGRTCLKLGKLDKASYYLRKVPRSGDDGYRSAVALLGDMAADEGDVRVAIEHYKEARDLGGSVMYPVATLDDKIEQLQKRQQMKTNEPLPVSIRVKHLHGALRGSCEGILKVDATGVRYDSPDHTFAANLLAVGVSVAKDGLTVRFQDRAEKFRPAQPAAAEKFREAVAKYQAYRPPPEP